MSKITNQLKIWTGKFGKNYTDRNALSLNKLEKIYKKRYGITRTEINKIFLDKLNRSIRILEVGSNIGNQLLCLKKMGFRNLYGIEPQDYSIELSKKRTKDINIIKGNIFDIPFKDRYFDLVFTSGVLIHISPKDIKKAVREIYRSTRKYIWGFEYFSEDYKEIIYRGQNNLLWKSNFLEVYLNLCKDLKLVKESRLKDLDNDKIDSMFLLRKKII